VGEIDVIETGDASGALDRIGADGAYAEDATLRVFEVTGLDATATEALAEAAGVYGATVAQGDSGLLLVGTVGALNRLAAGFEGPDAVESALTVVGERTRFEDSA
jgi:dihydropteroate synthase